MKREGWDENIFFSFFWFRKYTKSSKNFHEYYDFMPKNTTLINITGKTENFKYK